MQGRSVRSNYCFGRRCSEAPRCEEFPAPPISVARRVVHMGSPMPPECQAKYHHSRHPFGGVIAVFLRSNPSPKICLRDAASPTNAYLTLISSFQILAPLFWRLYFGGILKLRGPADVAVIYEIRDN